MFCGAQRTPPPAEWSALNDGHLIGLPPHTCRPERGGSLFRPQHRPRPLRPVTRHPSGPQRPRVAGAHSEHSHFSPLLRPQPTHAAAAPGPGPPTAQERQGRPCGRGEAGAPGLWVAESGPRERQVLRCARENPVPSSNTRGRPRSAELPRNGFEGGAVVVHLESTSGGGVGHTAPSHPARPGSQTGTFSPSP